MSLRPRRILAGLLLSTLIGIAAYRRRSLSRSGIAGATISGTATFGFGGWSWGLSLIFFFLSSSVLSHFRAGDKALTAADKFSKGGQRDIAQAMANGGMATLLSLGYGLTPAGKAHTLLAAGYVGALATATADTWATELGVLSKQPPRLITTGKLTSPGTSGGITLLGTSASVAGALALGMWFWLLRWVESQLGVLERHEHEERVSIEMGISATSVIAVVSGLTGALFDSLLGATVQAMYYCPTCAKETERRVHSCGTQTRPLRGVSWVDNDVVNFLATLLGSVVAVMMRLLWL
jgi:uncharacterized protein (TIGR00297 family)